MSETATAPGGPRGAVLRVRDEIAKAVVGQDGAVSGLVAALLVRGHVLLEGVPGVAKTLLVKTLARTLDLEFKRVQFTPDLMPSDVTGQVIFEQRDGSFRFRQGPVFTNLLLADEINRTPPKTQASLLEAMEERQVSVEGQGHPLPEPFLVVATQNPVEYEGTYPLPEAQLDRFLFKLQMGYPSAEQEQAVLARHDAGMDPHDLATLGVTAVAGRQDLEAARKEVAAIQVEAGCRPTSWPSPGRPGSRRRWSWASPPEGRPCCCTPPRPGPGWPGSSTSPRTRSRPWPSRPCATGSSCARRSSSRA